MDKKRMIFKGKVDSVLLKGTLHFLVVNGVLALLVMVKYFTHQVVSRSLATDVFPALLAIAASGVMLLLLKVKIKNHWLLYLHGALLVISLLWLWIALRFMQAGANVAGVVSVLAITSQAVISFYTFYSAVALVLWPLWGALIAYVFLSGGNYFVDELGLIVLFFIQNTSRRMLLELHVKNEARSLRLNNLITKYKMLANTDKLTNIPNRRHVYGKLNAYASLVQQGKCSLTLAIIDVDYFKLYNDNYGHLAGDECLVKIARCLSQSLRESDYIARYGGEEFIVIFPRLQISDCDDILQRLINNVRQLNIRHCKSAVADHVTISIGAAEWRSGSSSDRTLIDADTALYQAKSYGRNRYYVIRPE